MSQLVKFSNSVFDLKQRKLQMNLKSLSKHAKLNYWIFQFRHPIEKQAKEYQFNETKNLPTKQTK